MPDITDVLTQATPVVSTAASPEVPGGKAAPRKELAVLQEVLNTAMRARLRRGEKRVTEDQIDAYVQMETQLPSVKALIERIRQIESAPDPAGGVALSALGGVTFGWLDEAVGLIRGPEAKAELRRQAKAFRREHPKTAFVAEMGGAFLVPGYAALRGGKAIKSAWQAAKVGAAAGATEGALFGAGTAEPGKKLGGALIGGVSGGVGGGLLAPAAYGSTRALQRIYTSKAERIERKARDLAQDYARREDRAPKEILASFKRGQKVVPEMTLADTPEFRPVLAEMAQYSGKVRRAIRETMPARIAAEEDRVTKDLLRGVYPDTPTTIVARRQKLLADRKAMDVAYTELRKIPEVRSPAIEEMLTYPDVKMAFRKIAAVRSRVKKPLKKIFKVDKKGVMRTDEVPDFETLFSVKKQLDAKTNQLWSNPGTREQAKLLGDVRDSFYAAILDEVENFGATQHGYAALLRESDAMVRGQMFFKMTAEQMAEDMSKLTGDALNSYRDGAIASIVAKIRSRDVGSEVAKVFSKPDVAAKARQLFPDEGAFSRFLKGLELERSLTKTGKASMSVLERIPTILSESSTPLGSFFQRASVFAAQPEIAGPRIGAGVATRFASKAALKKAGLISEAMLPGVMGRGERGLLDASNLLTGEAIPAVNMDYFMRTPRALIGALRGGR